MIKFNKINQNQMKPLNTTIGMKLPKKNHNNADIPLIIDNLITSSTPKAESELNHF